MWEISQSSTNISMRITPCKEYLQKYIKNDEHSYKYVMGIFFAKVSV